MTIPLRADVAHVVAKLVARRTTGVDEIPMLMREVQTALERVMDPPPMVAAQPAPAPEPPRPTRVARPPPALDPVEKPSEPAPAPRLLRRADVVAPPTFEATALSRPIAASA